MDRTQKKLCTAEIRSIENNTKQMNTTVTRGVLFRFQRVKSEFFSQKQSPRGVLQKRLWHRCFPVNFAKFLKTTFLTEHLRWLLLLSVKNSKIVTLNFKVGLSHLRKKTCYLLHLKVL